MQNEEEFSAYGLEETELQHEEGRLNEAGSLFVPLTEHRQLDPATPSPLPIDTPGDKRNLPVENRFEEALKNERSEVMKVKIWMRLSVSLKKIWTSGRPQRKN